MTRAPTLVAVPGAAEERIQQTAEFLEWLSALRDQAAKAVIARRIDRMARGNRGDAKSIGDGVSEMRVDFGPGYRVYFTERKGTLVILLCGGDKSSQSRDIKRAKSLAEEF